MKDLFSKNSDHYARFRPTYPTELFEYILSLVGNNSVAWDCATGNGQFASVLAEHFETVHATDISHNQIKNAIRKENIFYKVEPAEHTSLPDQSLDIITVAQAVHWFDFDKFYAEVNRTLKPNGIIVITGYILPQIDEQIDTLIHEFETNFLGDYWDKETLHVDEKYATIPFPYQEIHAPEFFSTLYWSIEQLLGFLNTWSGVRHYIEEHDTNPVTLFEPQFRKFWHGNEIKEVKFPMLLRIGKANGN